MSFKRSLKSKGSVSWALSIPFSGDLESPDHCYLTTKHSTPDRFLQILSIINFAFDEWVILHQDICQLSKSPKWWPLTATLLSPALGQAWQRWLLPVSSQLFPGAVLTVAGWTQPGPRCLHCSAVTNFASSQSSNLPSVLKFLLKSCRVKELSGAPCNHPAVLLLYPAPKAAMDLLPTGLCVHREDGCVQAKFRATFYTKTYIRAKM